MSERPGGGFGRRILLAGIGAEKRIIGKTIRKGVLGRRKTYGGMQEKLPEKSA